MPPRSSLRVTPLAGDSRIDRGGSSSPLVLLEDGQVFARHPRAALRRRWTRQTPKSRPRSLTPPWRNAIKSASTEQLTPAGDPWSVSAATADSTGSGDLRETRKFGSSYLPPSRSPRYLIDDLAQLNTAFQSATTTKSLASFHCSTTPSIRRFVRNRRPTRGSLPSFSLRGRHRSGSRPRPIFLLIPFDHSAASIILSRIGTSGSRNIPGVPRSTSASASSKRISFQVADRLPFSAVFGGQGGSSFQGLARP